jgi:hypothetical protein
MRIGIRNLGLVLLLVSALCLVSVTTASAAAPPRISIVVPGQVEPGAEFAVTGSVTAAPERSRVRFQVRRGAAWKVVVGGPVRKGRYRLRAKLPTGSEAMRVRSVLASGGEVVALSPTRQVRIGNAAAARPAPSPPPPEAAAAPTPLPLENDVVPPPSVPIPAPGDMYWGGWLEGAPFDWSVVEDFEAGAGKGISLLEWSTPFESCSGGNCTPEPFPQTYFQKVRDHGAIPFFSWGSQTAPVVNPDPSYELHDIADGQHDAYIREWAKAAAAWGHPFFLRFDWEMNGNWFNWGWGYNNNTPADFVAAWQHVHTIFDQEGATNATWVWCPFVNPNSSPNIADPGLFYPGGGYVDWTCIDGYNWGTNNKPPRNWHTFEWWFGKTYDRVREIAPDKPMVVGEVASSEYGGSKAQWLEEMFTTLPTRFPGLRALVYFNVVDGEHDWPIETSEASEKAFAAGIADPRYRGSEFKNLGPGRIPAP